MIRGCPTQSVLFTKLRCGGLLSVGDSVRFNRRVYVVESLVLTGFFPSSPVEAHIVSADGDRQVCIVNSRSQRCVFQPVK